VHSRREKDSPPGFFEAYKQFCLAHFKEAPLKVPPVLEMYQEMFNETDPESLTTCRKEQVEKAKADFLNAANKPELNNGQDLDKRTGNECILEVKPQIPMEEWTKKSEKVVLLAQ